MSTTIDQRVVEMQFDNRNFESNVSTTMSTLDKLKQSLNLSGASKGLENVNAAANKCDMSTLGNAVESVKARFSALQVMGVTALMNITNSAVNAGKKIISALTIDPIKTGFQEYETQINAVQTILANTSHAGTTIQDVNKVLDELNTYADKTIYNFTQMTRNIGTFTAAGVDLETSASAIQGIANLAAVSGSTSQQASTAMYQLSQAIANGKVNLQDWNSVVNAGMGGKVFQDALVKTAATMKGVSEETFRAKNITGSFRESISAKDGEGWLTSDVLVTTLKQFTMAAEEGTEQWDAYKKSLMDNGYTETQAAEIIKMANTATDAATKVKTVTQLWDTLKESAQSGWTQSWEIVMGDFEEAKETLTKVSDVIGDMIGKSAEARNNLLEGALTSSWDQLTNKINAAGISTEDFHEKLKKTAEEHGYNIEGLLEDYGSLEHVFDTGEISADLLREAITGLSAAQLEGIKYTDEFKEKLTETAKEQGYNVDGLLEDYGSLEHLFATGELAGGVFAETMDKLSDSQLENMGYTEEQIDKLRSLRDIAYKTSEPLVELTSTLHKTSGRELIIESLWNAFDGLLSVIKPIKEAFSEIFPPATSDQLYKLIENVHKFTEGLTLSSETADKLKRAFKGLFSIFDMLRKGITTVVEALFNLSQSNGIKSLADMLLDAAASMGDFFTSINEGFNTDGLAGGLSRLTSGISGFIEKAVSGLRGFADILSSIGRFVAKVAKGIWNSIKEVFTWISENVSAGDIFAGLAGGGIFAAAKKLIGIFDNVQEALSNLFGKKDDGGGSKFSEILDSVKDSIDSFTSGIKIGSLVAIAVAVTLLSSALKKIASLDAVDISKGLFGIGAILAMLTVSFKALQKALFAFKPDGLITAGASMILIAAAVSILAKAIVGLSTLSLAELATGLVGVGGGLAILVLGLKAMNKVKIKMSTSVAILALATSCGILADALQKFGSMQWDEIGRGLAAMAGALVELVAVTVILGKFGGGSSLLGAAGLLVAVQSLEKLADGLKKFGSMSWDEIGRGLAAMGGALAEVSIVTGALGYLTGFSGILGGAAILVAVQGLGDLASALQEFGSMSWGEIGRGLAAMGGALAEVAVITGALGALAGLGGILGAGSILITIQGLGDLANALQEFGSMSWDEIGRGLVAMGGALAEIGVVTGALGMLSGLGGILGGGAILIAVQGLGDIADALQKFGSMSWDEASRGLFAMGGALTELAIVTGALGSMGLVSIIGSGSLLLAVQGLGDIADALQKFGEMSWDEIGRGLTAMGAALGEVALGSLLNTFSGIGAASLTKIAEPLGALADSVKKWSGVTVPDNLSSNLSGLAKGVRSFTFDGMGASALSTAAEPLGALADSVKKWAGVTVPDGIGEQLSSLAKGIRSFTFDGMGASALSTAAEPLGTLAESVKKWNAISVPEGLSDQLASLADGIKSFTWAFVGGWSLGSVTEPLGALADAVKKWNGVSISSDLSTQLGNLAGAVGKWALVSIPSSMGERLSSIADAAKKLSGINYKTIGSGLTTLSTSLGKFKSSTGSLSGVGKSITNNIVTPIKNAGSTLSKAGANLITSLTKGINSKKGSVKTAATSIVTNAVSAVKAKSSSLSSVGSTLATSFAKGLQSKQSAAVTATTSMVSAMVSKMKGQSSTFNSVGSTLMSKFVSGINSKKSAASSSLSSVLSSAASRARGYYGSFYSAGRYVAQGFAAGISSGSFAAVARARAMAAAAASAARAALVIRSPSRVFYQIGIYVAQGFANALADNTSKVYDAASDMANTAKNGFNNAVSKIRDVIEGNIDVQPTIRPVLDLSDVKAGAGVMDDMLGVNPSVGLLSNVRSINSAMKRNNQNGEAYELVSAIHKLRKDLGNIGNTTYSINGVTYDDGSNIADAVKTIVRAARVERRI